MLVINMLFPPYPALYEPASTREALEILSQGSIGLGLGLNPVMICDAGNIHAVPCLPYCV